MSRSGSESNGRPERAWRPAAVDGLERRAVLAPYTTAQLSAYLGSLLQDPQTADPNDPAESPAIVAAEAANQLTPAQVNTLLDRASAAVPDQSGIIAVVDRGGRILGVRAEAQVAPQILDNTSNLVFAVDGAVSLARTGAFFGNNQAPLTSRTIQDISQTTMTQREIEANPSIADPNSTVAGPGFVAPIGIKGHFPPRVPFTPQVDLFGIEFTNRDTSLSNTGSGVPLPSRFNVPTGYIPTTISNPANPGQANLSLSAPDSYGYVSGLEPNAQPRGIATLPGGIPLVKAVTVNGVKHTIIVGGIGVFYPGTTGYADAENSVLNDTGYNPKLPDKSVEAELVAFAAAGGASGASVLVGHPTTIGTLGGVPALPGFDLLPKSNTGQYNGRIDLVGVTLDVFGPHGNQGPINLFRVAPSFGLGKGTVNGINLPLPHDTGDPTSAALNTRSGQIVPAGWLVLPHDGVGITAQDVYTMVENGIARALSTRSAIRLPLNRHARMVFAVADSTGAILGLYRMPDSTVFSIGVAVAKARNMAYYNDPAQLQPQDQVKGVAPGTAFTNRTIRYLSLPFFPEGQDDYPPGPFSILNDGGTTKAAQGANVGPPLPASAFQSVMGYSAFHPNANFRAPTDPNNQNGIVFFPGSSGVYKTVNGTSTLVGGLGISGDGVDQDDDVTYSASLGYRPETVPRADMVKVRGVRLPYQKFNRNPSL